MIIPISKNTGSIDKETGNALVFKRKIEAVNSKMVSNFMELAGSLPAPGEMFALFTLKQFNAFSIVMAILKTHGKIDYLAVSSYNISRKTIAAFCELLSDNKILLMDIYISDVAKSMFPKSFEFLSEIAPMYSNLGVHYVWNHSKVAVINAGNNFFVCEGSGNFSYNARHEQYLLINSPEFYEFRRTNLVSMSER